MVGRKLEAYDNNASTIQIDYLAYLDQAKKSVIYKDERTAELLYRARQLEGTYGGSCVQFARYFTGMGKISGQARNLKTNSEHPEIESILKTSESIPGHLAVVLYVRDNSIYVEESNYNWNGIISTRWLSLTDPLIEGFYIEGGDNQ